MRFSARCRVEGAAHETQAASLCSQGASHCSPKQLAKFGDILLQGVLSGSWNIPLQNPTQPSASNHCTSWEGETWGLRIRLCALLFFGFYWSMLPGAAGVQWLKHRYSTAHCCSHEVSWQPEEPRLEQDGTQILDRAAAASLSCLALGLSDSQP